MSNPTPEIESFIDEQVSRALAFLNFWEFCLWYDYDFFSRRPFLKIVADGLQRVYESYLLGIALRLAASIPPRAGKSYITSLFCAWWLGKFPELSVMRNSCTATLYNKFSYDVRNIVKSQRYRAVFPTVGLADDKQNLQGWNLKTSKQVGYFGNGVGGTIIGFGANLALSDDLYRGIDDALSETYNESVIRWKESSHDSRKEKNCPEIFIGTRWSKRDVIGKAIEAGKVDIEIKIPALVVDENGQLRSFCEDVKSTAEYIEIRDSIDETIWNAEYMQEPIENKGLLFPKSELKFFKRSEFRKENSEHTYIPVDPADKGFDNYAAPTCELIGDKVLITRVIFNNHGTDINIPATVEMAIEEKASYMQIEGNSGWVLVGRNVRDELEARLPDCEVRITKATTNKETRILNMSAWIKRHVVFADDYKEDKQYTAFVNNITSYLREGGNKTDDGGDVLEMLANYFRRNFGHLWSGI